MAILFYFLADQFTLPLSLPRLSLISSSPYPPHLNSPHLFITLFPDLFISSSSNLLTLDSDNAPKVSTQSAATDPRTGQIDMDMITTGR